MLVSLIENYKDQLLIKLGFERPYLNFILVLVS